MLDLLHSVCQSVTISAETKQASAITKVVYTIDVRSTSGEGLRRQAARAERDSKKRKRSVDENLSLKELYDINAKRTRAYQ